MQRSRAPKTRANRRDPPEASVRRPRAPNATPLALASAAGRRGKLLLRLDRFGLSLAAAGSFFFWSGVLSAGSYLAAARIARRIGLVNTMVFTHLPSNILLILVPFAPSLWLALALLLARSALSQMDVPTRTSYVMAVVTPGERAAAAGVTAVPRSLAAAASPLAAGYMLGLSAFGWPLVAAGALKAIYDVLLLVLFRHRRPPEEQR